MIWEGEQAPAQTEDEAAAIRAYNLLSNGTGGIDWAGLMVAVELIGVEDIEWLIRRLEVIKKHRPPKSPAPEE